MTANNNGRALGFTEEQRQAIGERQVSVALSAGAGCGKTFVVCERFLSYFEPGAQGLGPDDVHRLVAITFTERAAREMRDRIRHATRARLAAATHDREHWAALLRKLDSARISTIHAYCASLVRTRAVEAGVDPHFVVLEQSQSDTLLDEVLEDHLRRLIAEEDESLVLLSAHVDLNRARDHLRLLALDLLGESIAPWLSMRVEEHTARWSEFHRQEVVPGLARRFLELPATREARSLLLNHRLASHSKRARGDAVLTAMDNLAAETAVDRIAQMFDSIQEHARVQGESSNDWTSAESYQRYRDAAKNLREVVKDWKPILSFDPRQAAIAAEVGRRMLAIAAKVTDDYTARKRALGSLDFHDLLLSARDLLTGDDHAELRQRLSTQIRLLMVDEFQDTDPLQVEVVRALCGSALFEGKLFVVGDYKQSIYRFRGADPTVFRQLREETPPRGRMSLTLNFRSQPAILDFVSALFCEEMGSDYEPLRAHRPQVSPTPAIEFLWAPSEPKESQESQRQREAEWIARRIAAIVASREPIIWDASSDRDHPRTRPAQPGDFALLFRALTQIEIYEDALTRHGIEYYLVGGHAFYAQQEIFDLVNLLRAVSNPSDDVSLVGVLRSGFFSLSDETIFWLASSGHGLWTALANGNYSTSIAADQLPRVRAAAEILAELRAKKDRLPIAELINLALKRTAYDAMLVGEFLGQRKLANVRKLVEQARAFGRSGVFGLADFIHLLSQFVAEQPKEPLAAISAEDAPVVRLMTIHQSKGLEFPIVIVPDFNGRTRNDVPSAHFDNRLGPLIKLPSEMPGGEVPGGFDLWRAMEAGERAAELTRMLYVATTRAADYLVLSGSTSPAGSDGPWAQLLSRRFDPTDGRLVADLPTGMAVPAIRVSSEPQAVDEKSSPQRGPNAEAMLEAARGATSCSNSLAAAVDPLPLDRQSWREISFSSMVEVEEAPNTTRGATPQGSPSDNPRSLGNLVHAILAAIDFNVRTDVKPLVELHALRQGVDNAEIQKQARAMIEQFLQSPRAQQLAKSKSAQVEVEFLLGWPTGRVKPKQLALRGYIDRLDQDDKGEWHVLDFKTNRLPKEGIAAIASRFEPQLLVYGLATEVILRTSLKSLTVHFLRTGEEHVVAWDKQAREKAIAFVEEFLASTNGK